MTRQMSAFAMSALLWALSLTIIPQAAAQEAALDLSPYTGQVVLVDFWASWCGPCQESFPWMNSLQHRLGEKGLQVIAVNVDRDTTKATAFLRKHPDVDLKIIFDPQGKIAAAYDLQGMPSSFLYDRDGHLVSSHIGFEVARIPAYNAAIDELLGKPGPSASTDTTETPLDD